MTDQITEQPQKPAKKAKETQKEINLPQPIEVEAVPSQAPMFVEEGPNFGEKAVGKIAGFFDKVAEKMAGVSGVAGWGASFAAELLGPVGAWPAKLALLAAGKGLHNIAQGKNVIPFVEYKTGEFARKYPGMAKCLEKFSRGLLNGGMMGLALNTAASIVPGLRESISQAPEFIARQGAKFVNRAGTDLGAAITTPVRELGNVLNMPVQPGSPVDTALGNIGNTVNQVNTDIAGNIQAGMQAVNTPMGNTAVKAAEIGVGGGIIYSLLRKMGLKAQRPAPIATGA